MTKIADVSSAAINGGHITKGDIKAKNGDKTENASDYLKKTGVYGTFDKTNDKTGNKGKIATIVIGTTALIAALAYGAKTGKFDKLADILGKTNVGNKFVQKGISLAQKVLGKMTTAGNAISNTATTGFNAIKNTSVGQKAINTASEAVSTIKNSKYTQKAIQYGEKAVSTVKNSSVGQTIAETGEKLAEKTTPFIDEAVSAVKGIFK